MKPLTYATVCSGIECMSVACRGLPLKPVFFSEIEPFPCAVLKAHYPDVPNLGDMSKITVTNKTEITNGTVRIVLDRPIDILAGGTPCQDVSVAGKRAGMSEGSGTRSSLAFDFVRLARELGPRFVIWENVAGAIDSKNAPDFLAFLRALGDCGYSLAWRVLDAQYVRVDGMERAVPQRRRRVWVVGCLGADESLAGKILFEPDCVAGHTAPRRRAGEGFAYSLAGRDRVDAPVVGGAPRAGGEGCLNPLDPQSKRLFTPDGPFHTVDAMNGGGGRLDGVSIALDGDKLKPREDQRKGGNGFGINEEGAGYTLTGVDRHGVAYGIGNGQAAEASITMKECPQTLNCMHDKQATVQCYENHAQDSRVQGPIDTAPTQGSSNANSAGISGNNPLVVMRNTPFVKTSHAKGKNGDGEKWEQCELAGTRNAIEGGDGRNQECIVSTNSNGGDVAATLNTAMAKLGGDNQTTFGGMSLAAVGIGHDAYNCGRNAKMGMSISSEVEPTMKAKSDGCGAVAIAREGAEGE